LFFGTPAVGTTAGRAAGGGCVGRTARGFGAAGCDGGGGLE